MIQEVIHPKPIPQQGFRACLGILRFGSEKSYGEQRLEAAAKRALVIGATSYQSIESILKKGLDQKPLPATELPLTTSSSHANVRGSVYYS